MRFNREEPPGELKEDREPTVNPTLFKDTPFQVFKHAGDPRCVVVSAQAPPSRAALYPFDSYMNRYSQRLDEGPMQTLEQYSTWGQTTKLLGNRHFSA